MKEAFRLGGLWFDSDEALVWDYDKLNDALQHGTGSIRRSMLHSNGERVQDNVLQF